MKKVLIPTKLDAVAAAVLKEGGNYEVVQDGSVGLAQLADLHPDAFALIVRSEKVSAEIIDKLPALKVIVRAGAGYNTIDAKHARRKGIDVMNTPGANANAVAEEVIAMILADARHIVSADVSAREGRWEKSKFMGRELANKTVGIVGLGHIGRTLARRLSGFEVKLLGHDPVVSPERVRDMGVEPTSLEALFAESDYITLHLPENDETRHLVNEDLLKLVKEGATILNCARAGIIQEEALRSAKDAKRLRFLNDVYAKDAEGEKSVKDIADIMLPHLGASTVEANYNAARRAAEQLIDLEQKGVTSFIVNRDIPEELDRSFCELANLQARMCRSLLGKGTGFKLIETSFYGSLEQYANWLLVPIVAAISEDFDRSMDYHAAQTFLTDAGIDYVNRSIDPDKRYDNSITLDMTGATAQGTLKNVSVRGTVTEGLLIVSRINEFDKLWFEPTGHSVMFLYEDRPGVLGTIGVKLASYGVNIEDVRNPHDSRTNRSLAIMKVNQSVSPEHVDEISGEIQALAAFNMSL